MWISTGNIKSSFIYKTFCRLVYKQRDLIYVKGLRRRPRLVQWQVHWSKGTSTSVTTWMGDHQGRPGAVNLGSFGGVDSNMWLTVYIADDVVAVKWINPNQTLHSVVHGTRLLYYKSKPNLLLYASNASRMQHSNITPISRDRWIRMFVCLTSAVDVDITLDLMSCKVFKDTRCTLMTAATQRPTTPFWPWQRTLAQTLPT